MPPPSISELLECCDVCYGCGLTPRIDIQPHRVIISCKFCTNSYSVYSKSLNAARECVINWNKKQRGVL